MKKTLATLAVAAVAAFGLSACSSGSTPEESPKPAPVETQAPEPTETTGLDQSTIQACLDMQGPMNKALEDMQAIQAGGGDSMDQWHASWDELEEALSQIANSSSTEVKNAASSTHTSAAAVGDLMQRLADGDVNAAAELVTAQSEFQSSYSELLGLCAP